MDILALLTARGNNTLKDKNILKINKQPVLSYPCKAAKKVREIKNFYVSSEDKKILNSASKYGFKKILRPKKFAKANSQHIDTLKHAVSVLKKDNINKAFEILSEIPENLKKKDLITLFLIPLSNMYMFLKIKKFLKKIKI